MDKTSNNRSTLVSLKQSRPSIHTNSSIPSSKSKSLINRAYDISKKAFKMAGGIVEHLENIMEGSLTKLESSNESSNTHTEGKVHEDHSITALGQVTASLSVLTAVSSIRELGLAFTEFSSTNSTDKKIQHVRTKLGFQLGTTSLDVSKAGLYSAAKFATVSAAVGVAAVATSSAATGIATLFKLKSFVINQITKNHILEKPKFQYTFDLDNDLKFSNIQKSLIKKSNKQFYKQASAIVSGSAATVGLGLLAAGLVSNPVGWTIIGAGIVGIGAMAFNKYLSARHQGKINHTKAALIKLNNNSEKSMKITIPSSLAFKLQGSKIRGVTFPDPSIMKTYNNVTLTIYRTKDNVEKIKKKLENDLMSRNETDVSKHFLDLYYNNSDTSKQVVLLNWLETSAGVQKTTESTLDTLISKKTLVSKNAISFEPEKKVAEAYITDLFTIVNSRLEGQLINIKPISSR